VKKQIESYFDHSGFEVEIIEQDLVFARHQTLRHIRGFFLGYDYVAETLKKIIERHPELLPSIVSFGDRGGVSFSIMMTDTQKPMILIIKERIWAYTLYVQGLKISEAMEKLEMTEPQVREAWTEFVSVTRALERVYLESEVENECV